MTDERESPQTRVEIERLRARAAAARDARQPRRVIDLVEEAKRKARARAKAMAGTEHETYFPRLTCAICGGVPWLDEERGRVREHHIAERHGVTSIVTNRVDPRGARESHDSARTRGAPSSISDLVRDANERARRSTGERDDE